MYMLLEEVDSAIGRFEIPKWLSKKKYFKILVHGANNSVNVWKVNEKTLKK